MIQIIPILGTILGVSIAWFAGYAAGREDGSKQKDIEEDK